MLKLQIFLLEANLPDAEAVAATLLAGRFDGELLETHAFDRIVADSTLPELDRITALEIARNLRPETPLIFVSDRVANARTFTNRMDMVRSHRHCPPLLRTAKLSAARAAVSKGEDR